MSATSSLQQYRRKRDFRRTFEPSRSHAKSSSSHRFVIQKHAASRLHYDFRLQVGRVLKSWAVPKGPSLDPGDRRLAVEVEDHPLDYANFEGVIPKGEYGGGTVMVWDTGQYHNITKKNGKVIPINKALSAGHVSVWLDGKKLKGGFTLIHTRPPKEKNWLLIKLNDDQANARRKPLKTQTKSAVSGRTMNQIAKEEG